MNHEKGKNDVIETNETYSLSSVTLTVNQIIMATMKLEVMTSTLTVGSHLVVNIPM